MEPVTRIIETEIDLAAGIVIERAAEQRRRHRRGVGRPLVLLGVTAALASGLAAAPVRSAERAESGGSHVVRTEVQVPRLRVDHAPCRRGAPDVVVCGVDDDTSGGEALHE